MRFTTTPVHQPQGSKIRIQTILNRVEKQKGFVYSKASFNKKRGVAHRELCGIEASLRSFLDLLDADTIKGVWRQSPQERPASVCSFIY
jgi:hypothetical protein